MSWGVFAIVGKKLMGVCLKMLKISGSSKIIENINFSGMLSFFGMKKLFE